MGSCACVVIGKGKHRGMYGIRGVLERRKYTEVYKCVGSAVLGLFVGAFLEVIIGGRKVWEE